jgi:hypothetical protein
MYTKFWLDNLKRRDHSEDHGIYMSSLMDLKEVGRKRVNWIADSE